MKFPNVPIIGLTASGTHSVRTDISKLLALKDPILFSSGFNRPNLFYEVRDKPSNIVQEIAHFITNKHNQDSGIIYCNFIKDCELLSNSLKHNYKLKSAYYHSELDPKKKAEIQKK